MLICSRSTSHPSIPLILLESFKNHVISIDSHYRESPTDRESFSTLRESPIDQESELIENSKRLPNLT